MSQPRFDVPLDKDAASRFLPALVALTVFLAAMALAGMMVLDGLVGRWSRDAAGTITVQIPAATGIDGEKRTHNRLQSVLGLLRETPGIERADALPRARIAALLEPWLGSSELLGELPLPILIDVQTLQDAKLDLAALKSKLAAIHPGIGLEDHRVWLKSLLRLARALQALAGAVLLLVGLVTAATVIYATRTGMAVHHHVVELLHLIGAQDDYIAKQFSRHAFRLSLRGGVIGLMGAVPSLIGLGMAAKGMEGGFLPELWLSPLHWAGILSLPLVSGWLSVLAARFTVGRVLSGMT
jgi:cell division transport system permease protein